MMSFEQHIQTALSKRKAANLYRQRRIVNSPQTVFMQRDGREYLSFCSNDYLGLANDQRIVEAFQQAALLHGVGSGASHLVNGHNQEHELLEEDLAKFTGRERALVFSTGYMANLGIINALVGKGDAVFEDKLNHASLIDGGLSSSAEFVRYRHNDMDHLQSQLEKSQAQRKLIVTDGVFSMDGDIAKLKQMSQLAAEHNGWVMVDDAHGIGVLGEQGRGTVDQLNCSVDDVPVLVGTLGKAFGTFGAFVAGSEALIEYLIQFSRTYIYTTALPAAVAAATRASLGIVMQEQQRRDHLVELVNYFRAKAASRGICLMESSTPIQPVMVGDEAEAMAVSARLEQQGIWVTAIRPPTVPAGTSRLRVTLSAQHNKEHIDQLIHALCDQA